MDVRRIVKRYLKQAGDVVPFGKRGPVGPKKPTNNHLIRIHGVDYFLSNDGGPLGSDEDDTMLGDMSGTHSEGGARLINVTKGERGFKFLWVMDTDRKTVTMWRVTDGNEKLHATAGSMQAKIVKLDGRNQFNRIDHKTFVLIEKVMGRIADEELEAMKRTIEENKSDTEREIARMVQDYVDDMLAPQIQKAISNLEHGAPLLGFKPHDPNPANLRRQQIVFVIGQILRRDFTQDKVEDYLRTEGLDPEGSDVGIQDIEWAINEATDKLYDDYLPTRIVDESR